MRRRSFSVLVLTLLAACSDTIDDRTAVEPSTGLRFLGGETGDGFARATAPRRFVFPADHGSHPDYRTEWSVLHAAIWQRRRAVTSASS